MGAQNNSAIFGIWHLAFGSLSSWWLVARNETMAFPTHQVPWVLAAAAVTAIPETALVHPIQVFCAQQQLARPPSALRFVCTPSSGWYRGVLPHLVGLAPMRTVFWSTLHWRRSVAPHESPWLTAAIVATAQSVVDTPMEARKVWAITATAAAPAALRRPSVWRALPAQFSRNALFLGVFLQLQEGVSWPLWAAAAGGVAVSHPLEWMRVMQQSAQPLRLHLAWPHMRATALPRLLGCVATMLIGQWVFQPLVAAWSAWGCEAAAPTATTTNKTPLSVAPRQ